MAEGLRTCAKAGWLCAARSRWRLTAGERSSLGTYLAYPFGPAAHIPTRPLNGQETAGGGCQNGRSSPDPPLLSPLRDGGRPPCCCRGFRRALLGAAPPLDVRRPCWQPAPRPAGVTCAAGPLAPGSELRMWELGAGLQGACRATLSRRRSRRRCRAASFCRPPSSSAHPSTSGRSCRATFVWQPSEPAASSSSGEAAAQGRRWRRCRCARASRAGRAASTAPTVGPVGAVPSPPALSARTPLISPRPAPPQPPHPTLETVFLTAQPLRSRSWRGPRGVERCGRTAPSF